jgi:hypothetical protein
LEEKGEEDERRRNGFWLGFLVFLTREEWAAVMFIDILHGKGFKASRRPKAHMTDASAFLPYQMRWTDTFPKLFLTLADVLKGK